MSMSDPVTVECCYCHAKHTFEDQGQAISSWSVEEDKAGKMFALCSKHRLDQEANDARSRLIMGKPPADSAIKPDTTEGPKLGVPACGIIIRATFTLTNVEVSSGGRILSGEPTPIDAVEIGNDLASMLELGKKYYINLK